MNLRNRYNELMAVKKTLNRSLLGRETTLEKTIEERDDHIKARALLTELIEQTQNSIKDKVETLVTTAIRSVFDRDFKFELRFEQKRNKVECTPIIIEGDHIYDEIPDDLGGGLLPVISFALRVVFWSLKNDKIRPTIILDEPIKGSLGGDLLDKTINMYKEISEKVGLQLIMITHYDKLADIADTVYNISHKNGFSIIEKN